jgi:PAS domain S-box-containing protein
VTEPLPHDDAVAALAALHDRLQKAQAEESKAFEEAFRNTPAGIGVHEIDVDHVVVRVNPEELRILGYRADQMVGHPVWDFIVMQEAAQRAIDQKLKGSRELKPFVRTFRRADGQALPLLLMDRRLVDANGKVLGIRTAMTRTKPTE